MEANWAFGTSECCAMHISVNASLPSASSASSLSSSSSSLLLLRKANWLCRTSLCGAMQAIQWLGFEGMVQCRLSSGWGLMI